MTKPSADRIKRDRDYAAALARNGERVKRDIRQAQEALDKHRRSEMEKRKR